MDYSDETPWSNSGLGVAEREGESLRGGETRRQGRDTDSPISQNFRKQPFPNPLHCPGQ